MTAAEIAARVCVHWFDAPPDARIVADILQDRDRGAEYLCEKDYYAFYWALGRVVGPRRYAELGVKFGYSALAVARGAGTVEYIRGFDSELDTPGSCAVAEVNLEKVLPGADVKINKVELDELVVLGGGPYDLIHCDAGHNYEGACRDIRLALGAVRPGGVVVVDDYFPRKESDRAHTAEIRRAVADTRLPHAVVPTLQGLAVLVAPG